MSYDIDVRKDNIAVTITTASSISTLVEDAVVETPYIAPECECVRYLREVLDVPIRGNAQDILPNVDIPIVGGVVLLEYGDYSHAAQIQYLLPKCMYVKQGNKISCQATEECIPYDSENIRGFWFKNLNSPLP